MHVKIPSNKHMPGRKLDLSTFLPLYIISIKRSSVCTVCRRACVCHFACATAPAFFGACSIRCTILLLFCFLLSASMRYHFFSLKIALFSYIRGDFSTCWSSGAVHFFFRSHTFECTKTYIFENKKNWFILFPGKSQICYGSFNRGTRGLPMKSAVTCAWRVHEKPGRAEVMSMPAL